MISMVQDSLRVLKNNDRKIGILIHGTGGLGKTCLAGKLCERFPYHNLIIVHGILNSLTLLEALEKGFRNAGNEGGLKILEQEVKLPEKLKMLCNSVFKEKNYLILLDDFEQNFPDISRNEQSLTPLSEATLKALLLALSDSNKKTQIIITSRYKFSLPHLDSNLILRWLSPISLNSFHKADSNKKAKNLENIRNLDSEIKGKLIDAGCGNPRLLGLIDTMIGESNDKDIELLLEKVSMKQEEFVEDLLLKQIISSQPINFKRFLCNAAVFFSSVSKQGFKHVCMHIPDWEAHMRTAIRLSLIEVTKVADYPEELWLTPLLSKELFAQLPSDTQLQCHRSAVQYFQTLIIEEDDYNPWPAIQLINHAAKANMPDEAVQAGGPLLNYLRKTLAYQEALAFGRQIEGCILEFKNTDEYADFLNAYGLVLLDTGNREYAYDCLTNALSISKLIYGEKHSKVAICLNNVGSAHKELEEYSKAIESHEKANEIFSGLSGEPNQANALSFNNLGLIYCKRGELNKAVHFYNQAYEIYRKKYGEEDPRLSTTLNNLGRAYSLAGKHEESIKKLKKADEIYRKKYGEQNPLIAAILNNLGLAYYSLKKHEKAIQFYERALSIVKKIYPEKHPDTSKTYHNLAEAYKELGRYKDSANALEYAISIDKYFCLERLDLAKSLNELGAAYSQLGYLREALKNVEEACEIYYEVLGVSHPDTFDLMEIKDSIRTMISEFGTY